MFVRSCRTQDTYPRPLSFELVVTILVLPHVHEDAEESARPTLSQDWEAIRFQFSCLPLLERKVLPPGNIQHESLFARDYPHFGPESITIWFLILLLQGTHSHSDEVPGDQFLIRKHCGEISPLGSRQ